MKNKIILFQGDSITDAGRHRNRTENDVNIGLGDGYVTMIAGELTHKYPWLSVVNRGISGDRIADTYGRWQEDTLNMKYDMLSFMSGINDVGFALRLGKGSDAKRFEYIYDRMIYEACESHPQAKLILGQPFVMRKDLAGTELAKEYHNDIFMNWNIWSDEIKLRGEIVEKISQKYGAIYVRFWDVLNKALENCSVDQLTIDCVHLTVTGNYVLAEAWKNATKSCLEEWDYSRREEEK